MSRSKPPGRRSARIAVVTALFGALAISSAPVANADDDPDVPVTLAFSAVLPGLSDIPGPGYFLPIFGAAPRAMARLVVPASQFPSFDNIITRESGWNTFAINPVSGAYGLGQALPPEKMASHGPDWRVNPLTQIRWAYDYMNHRYGSPDAAWEFWQQHHWY
ncbi:MULTISPECIES: transglycosylase SLT domain-containing protein [unclassified Nocardia]|uniref:aggregation-promoting factor C-terminal-like domain-containing protein n=1 Tax=unclassified Nocardia TaxID=2637762 RepID=UPI001CE40052|nr:MULTISPECIES: transglycosylase SLT domain-containing protein [unclassified Nocardia]